MRVCVCVCLCVCVCVCVFEREREQEILMESAYLKDPVCLERCDGVVLFVAIQL